MKKSLIFAASVILGSQVWAVESSAQVAEIFVGEPTVGQDSAHLASLPRSSSTVGGGTRSTTLATSGPAPSLSYLEVSYVGSANVGGYESIAPSQLTTVYDHGGTWLRVVTDELGYGNNPVARFNGSILPSSANIQTQNICWTGSGYTLSCSAGQTIVGFRKYWKLDGYQGGNFSYQNTSTNSPWNTMSDSISIQ